MSGRDIEGWNDFQSQQRQQQSPNSPGADPRTRLVGNKFKSLANQVVLQNRSGPSSPSNRRAPVGNNTYSQPQPRGPAGGKNFTAGSYEDVDLVGQLIDRKHY